MVKWITQCVLHSLIILVYSIAKSLNLFIVGKQSLKLITFVFGAFALIAAFFSVFAIPDIWIRKAIFITTIVCAVIAVFFFIKFRKYNHGATALKNALSRSLPPQSSDFTIRTVNTEAQLREIWEISQEIYGEDNVPFPTVLTWWRTYQNGIYVLVKENTVVGYLSIWPIKQQTFKDVCRGIRREKEMTMQSIVSGASAKPRTFWYITNIVIIRKFRKEKAIIVLLREAIGKWLHEANLDAQIRICAVAYSEDGKAVLQRFGFYKERDAKDTIEDRPIYTCTITLQDLTKIVGSIDVK